jgi:heme-degrading monooxygenase HmoA
MFVLHVDLTIKPMSHEALETTYNEIFEPAISSQEGFSAVSLLRSSVDEEQYRLSIAFDRQASQQKWIASDLHQRVWPQMESHCAGYSVKLYNTV